MRQAFALLQPRLRITRILFVLRLVGQRRKLELFLPETGHSRATAKAADQSSANGT